MNSPSSNSSTFLSPTTCFSIACLAFSFVALTTVLRNSTPPIATRSYSHQPQKRKAVDNIYLGEAHELCNEHEPAEQSERITELLAICTRICQALTSNQQPFVNQASIYDVLQQLTLITTALYRMQQEHATLSGSLQSDNGRKVCLTASLELLRTTLLSLEDQLSGRNTDPKDLRAFQQQLKSQRSTLDFLLSNPANALLPPTPPLDADTSLSSGLAPALNSSAAITPSADEKCWIEPPPEYSPPTDDSSPLIAEKADSKPRPSSPDRETTLNADALHNAIISDDTATLAQLLSKGADPTTTFGGLKRTPLHLAAHLNHHTCISTLLKHGAEMSTEDAKGDTPLHLAAWAGNVETLNILISHGADVDWLSGRDGYSPLWCSISAHQIDAARLLLKHGARVSQKANGLMPLHQAAVTGQTAMCELLIERGAKIDCLDDDKNTPLHYASACGSVTSVKSLLRAGADIEAKQTYGLRPVHWAAHKGHAEVLELLLDRGAKIDVKAEEGATPLHLAAARGHVGVVKLLLEKGCHRRPGSARWDGVVGSPAEMAKGKGFGRVVRLLRN